jgi:outer membrane protein assembly factor BamB/Flp pilus assembly protein TadD
VRWKKSRNGQVCSPFAYKGRVIAAWQDDAIVSFSAETGDEVWKAGIHRRIVSAPVTDGRLLYFLTTGSYAAALRLDTGQEVWRLPIDGVPSDGRPCLDRGVLYAGVADRLYAINAESGEVLWAFHANFPIGAVAAGEGLIFLTSRILSIAETGEHVVVAIDPEIRPRREAYWKRKFGDSLYGEMTIQDGVLYLGSRDHRVYALHIKRAQVGPIRAAEIWNQIGLVHTASGNKRKAIAAFEQAIELNPAHRESYRNLVDLYLDDGRIAKAIENQQSFLDFLKGEQGEEEAQARLKKMSGLQWAAPTRALYPLALFPNLDRAEDIECSPITPSPAASGEGIYIGGIDGIMRRLDATTGKEAWSFHVEGERSIRSTAALRDGRVYFGSATGAIHALDAETGSEVWSYPTGARVDSSPTIDGGVLFAGSDDKHLYALDAATGALRWSFQTGGAVKSCPAVDNDIVCFGSYDGSIYALNRHDGSERWTFQTGDIVNSSPRIAHGKVFLGADDGNVYALDAQSGAVVWEFEVEEQTQSALRHGLSGPDGSLSTFGFLPSSPAISGGIVFAGSNGQSACRLYALNAETGKVVWVYQVDNGEVGSPSVWRNVVFFGSGGLLFHNPFLYAVAAHDGSLLWKFRTTGDVLPAPAMEGDTAFCWCTSGDVFSFRVDSIPQNNPERDVEYYRNRARVFFENRRYTDAIEQLEAAQLKDPHDARVVTELADCYEALGQDEKQRDALLAAQQMDKSSTPTCWRLGWMYMQEGRVDAAIEQFRTYTRLRGDAGKPLGHWALGHAYLTKGQLDEALKEWNIGIETAARFVPGRIGTESDRRTAISALRLLFRQQAAALFDHGIAIDGRLSLTLLEQAGLEDEAIGTYAGVKALISEQNGDYDTADPCYVQALKWDPEWKNLLIRSASTLHDSLHRYDRAYSIYMLLSETDSDDASLLLSAAESALNAGRVREALERTQGILDSDDLALVFVARVIRLFARLQDGDERQFEAERKAVEALTANLLDSFPETWRFAGTRYAIEMGALPAEKKQWALRLIDSLGPKLDRKTLAASL